MTKEEAFYHQVSPKETARCAICAFTKIEKRQAVCTLVALDKWRPFAWCQYWRLKQNEGLN